MRWRLWSELVAIVTVHWVNLAGREAAAAANSLRRRSVEQHLASTPRLQSFSVEVTKSGRRSRHSRFQYSVPDTSTYKY